jgi:RNA polymerase sigma-70 factor (ECF subfamily)
VSHRDGSSGTGKHAAAELIVAARAGSPAALNELLTNYRLYLLRIASQEFPSDLQGKVGASDLVQETMLHAAGNFGEFVGESETELLGWMRRILLNQMLNTIRHYRTEKRNAGREAPLDGRMLAGHGDSTPSSEFIAQEERLLVQLALLQLPEIYRQAIVLRHEQDLSFVEIGARLGCSEDAARKLWGRAVLALQQELQVHE